MNAVLFAIVAYVLVQFAIGAWVSRRITSANDYILAGRRLGTGLVAFSVFATYFGAEAIVASGGAVYEHGLARRARRSIRLRGSHHHRRPPVCQCALVARAHHVRGSLQATIFARASSAWS